MRRANVVKLALFALGVWILRWAAQELVAYAGRHWQQPGPPPRHSPRRPGWMPGPSERALRRVE